MAGGVPSLDAKVVVKTFEALGWSIARQRGSHIIMTKPGNRATLSVPDHDPVARGTLRSLLRAAGLAVEEFVSAIP
jgi:predicted RNA binding protein YcfA (HicA-like mRNA interferase family)